MSESIRYEHINSVGLITLDNPPVNAFSLALRVSLRDALTQAIEDDGVTAIVITGGGRMFSAGADITEFDSGVSNQSPTLPELIELVENAPKPVVAAIHGNAMGGGCELCLGCHGRVAASGTKIGLPEVTLGIVPGAGGTQRMPRLIGVPAALNMIVSGKPLTAEQAHKLGLIDELTDSETNLVESGLSLALQLAELGDPVRTRDRDERLAEARDEPELFDQFRRKIAHRARGFEAPYACIECVEAALWKPFSEGVLFERETFQRCRKSLQSKAQRHVFFAERQARKVQGLASDTTVLQVTRAAVLGCGTMGGGIAMCFANAGIRVTVTESTQDALDRGMDMIRKNYHATVSKGRLSREDAEARLALIEPTLDFETVGNADFVIEAVFENMDLKKDIFARLDSVCHSNAVLATNTSSLDINDIAAVTSRPGQVLGTHFFSPANVMRLLEIVRGSQTSPEVLATAMSLSQRLQKVGVVVGVCDSFAANRMLYPYTRQAEFLVEEGALPEQVDRVIYDLGFPMGPFAMSDLAGLDVGYKIRQHREPSQTKNLRHSTIADQLYELGRYGQKTRAGWYQYGEDGRTPVSDPEVTQTIIATSEKLGIDRTDIPDEEILQRCMYPLINEGARILEEGIVERSSDLDLVWLYGYGFPRYRGGPMFWADSLGLAHVYETMKKFHEVQPDWLEPAPLLEQLAREGKTFGEWRAP